MGVFFPNPPLFNVTNFMFWKVIIISYFQELGADVWENIGSGNQYLTSISTNNAGNKQYKNNVKDVDVILGVLAE